ncbi:MAG: hypothetical protein M3Y17_13710 [Actinomycetota bacterium]|nr:hypothetical protein [Actinomycetota bacterium]
MDGNASLSRLRGGDVDTVSFVRNYVEFRIDCNVLRALVPPEIQLADGRRFKFPAPGSRDALCSLINATVESAIEVGTVDSDDWRIEVRTDSGELLIISLTDDPGGPESAHLVPADAAGRLEVARMFIWQLGTGSCSRGG